MVPKLSLKDISKTFISKKDQLLVLRNIAFDVFPNEFVCLVGPSGCGKTTLLKIIGGLVAPTTGSIFIDGELQEKINCKIGIVFQNLALFPWFSVWSNIEFGLKNFHVAPDKRNLIIKKYIDLIGLEGFENYFPHQLSGGMQQRVALARSLAYNPEILLLDEPFSSLDAFTKEKMQFELLQIWRETKKTVIFVTHDIEEAIYLGQKVIVMNKRPGEIKKIFNVSFLKERRPEIKTSREFNELREQIMTSVK